MTTQSRGWAAPDGPKLPNLSPQPMRLCQACPHRGATCLPGLRLMRHLSQAVALAQLGPEFEIAGDLEAEGCVRPCRLLWRATAAGTWIFGDVAPDADLDALIRAADMQEQAKREAPVAGAAAVLVARAGRLS